MNAVTFMQNFGYLADAPNGVQKLRELVLQLAVQGQLTEQQPTDGTAEDLIERATEEKKRLIQAGELRKSKSAGPVTSADLPFQVPPTWAWSRLNDLGVINPRNEADDDTTVSFVPMTLISEQYGELPQSEARKWSEVKSGYTHFAEGDVALAKITPCFQNRKSTVMRDLYDGIGAGTTELHVFRPLAGTLLPEYVVIFLKSHRFVDLGVTKMTGSAGQKRVPKDYFANSPFPVPPLPEQQRIVAKVDELMALCDELESQQQERRAVHVRLNEAALDRLTAAEEFTTAWSCVCENFDLLYSVPETVDQLRQTILQLAVRGRLIEPNPNDEPASELLRLINFQRRECLERGEAKKVKSGGSVSRDDAGFPYPAHWEITRFGEILSYGPTNGISPKPSDQTSATKSLTLTAVTSGTFDQTQVKYLDETYEEESPIWLREGDLLIQRANTREYVGVSAVVHGLEDSFVYPDLMMKVRVVDALDPNFVHLMLSSPDARDYWRDRSTGTSSSMKKINQSTVCSLPFPIPPRAEQQRLLQRVKRLSLLCNELEAKLTQQQSDADRLTEAMVAAILDGAVDPPETKPQPKRSETRKLVALDPVVAGEIDFDAVRGAISSYAVNQLHKRKSFGRTQHAKVLSLVQSHVGLDLGITFQRQAAGPFHPCLYDLERYAKRSKWYRTQKRKESSNVAYEYFPGNNIGDQVNLAAELLGDKQAEVDRVLTLFSKMRTRRAELIATTFCAWNDFLIDGTQPSDPEIIEAFFDWHEAKHDKFKPEQVTEAIAWIRDNDLVPAGKGRRTVEATHTEGKSLGKHTRSE